LTKFPTSPLERASTSARVGELSDHSTRPVRLSRARKLGASGEGMLMCPSSTPLAVTTNRVSPTSRGEQMARLCGKTFSSLIMSSRQMTSASRGPWYFSSCTPWLPSAIPSVSAQTTSQQLLT
jgi:hypothetical protein